MRIDIPRSVELYSHLRQMVEAGAEDGPVEVFHDGRHCLTVRSLHTSALRAIAEEPALRTVNWTPHPMAVVGPRMHALLDARAARKAAA